MMPAMFTCVAPHGRWCRHIGEQKKLDKRVRPSRLIYICTGLRAAEAVLRL